MEENTHRESESERECVLQPRIFAIMRFRHGLIFTDSVLLLRRVG